MFNFYLLRMGLNNHAINLLEKFDHSRHFAQIDNFIILLSHPILSSRILIVLNEDMLVKDGQ